MNDDEIQQLIGFTRKVKQTSTSSKVLRIEPEGPPIKNYPKMKVFQKQFYDEYVDESKQPWDAVNCSFESCSYTNRIRTIMRNHYMSHFDVDLYVKYKCTRCYTNYGDYNSLLNHERLGQCWISSDYPNMNFFVKKFLAEIGDSEGNGGHVCSKCKRNFAFKSRLNRHLMSCYRFTYPCYKCDKSYPSYDKARVHYENCTESDSKVPLRCITFISDKITPPAQEIRGKKWTEDDMIDYIDKNAVQQIKNLFAKYPKIAFGIIGQTKNIKKRFHDYNSYDQVYKFSELGKYLEFDESVLFRCWNRYDALLFEYLLQKHLIKPDGKYYGLFGHRMNQQQVIKPHKMKEWLEEGHFYVYFRASRKPFTWSKSFLAEREECLLMSPEKKKMRISSASTSDAFTSGASTSRVLVPVNDYQSSSHDELSERPTILIPQ